MSLPQNIGDEGGNPAGAVVAFVLKDSPAQRAGIQPGDRVVSVSGKPIKDFLDLYLSSFGDMQVLTLERNGVSRKVEIKRASGAETGLVLETGKPKQCTNKCIFCFIDQLGPGLRPELYVKDEDYRLSFLHGNYITLGNLTAEDEKRIFELRLSPLYVSVHATDPDVRDSLLGRKQREPILNVLDRFGKRGIRFHTQAVVVPGYNDGLVLERTIADLTSRHTYVLSLSIVPVGLTRHRLGLPKLRSLSTREARDIVELVARNHEAMRSEIGRGVVYASDEIFELASVPIPEADYYDDYPQLENGVGMLRVWLESLKHLKIPYALSGKHLVLVTGRASHRYIEDFAKILGDEGISCEVRALDNTLFGRSVTVSGLLSGRDILQALKGMNRYDAVVLPPNVINDSGLLIDDLTCDELERAIGVPVILGDYEADRTLEKIYERLHGPRPRDE